MSNILIVDDQPHLRELLSQELIDEGHKVFDTGNADCVLEYVDHSKPDVVLLDLYLNGFEGWEILHDIKARYPHIPVLIVTAYDCYMNDPRVSQADGYIVKKFDALDALKNKITKVLM